MPVLYVRTCIIVAEMKGRFKDYERKAWAVRSANILRLRPLLIYYVII